MPSSSFSERHRSSNESRKMIQCSKCGHKHSMKYALQEKSNCLNCGEPDLAKESLSNSINLLKLNITKFVSLCETNAVPSYPKNEGVNDSIVIEILGILSFSFLFYLPLLFFINYSKVLCQKLIEKSSEYNFALYLLLFYIMIFLSLFLVDRLIYLCKYISRNLNQNSVLRDVDFAYIDIVTFIVDIKRYIPLHSEEQNEIMFKTIKETKEIVDRHIQCFDIKKYILYAKSIITTFGVVYIFTCYTYLYLFTSKMIISLIDIHLETGKFISEINRYADIFLYKIIGKYAHVNIIDINFLSLLFKLILISLLITSIVEIIAFFFLEKNLVFQLKIDMSRKISAQIDSLN